MNTPARSEDTSAAPASRPSAPQSRAQRRYVDRINQQAQQLHQSLSDKFLDHISSCDDPEGQETVDLMDKLCAQWRTWCRAKRLNDTALPLMRNYCMGLMKQYTVEKTQN